MSKGDIHAALEATKASGGRVQLTIDGQGRYIVDYGRHFPRQGYYETLEDAAQSIMEYAKEQKGEA